MEEIIAQGDLTKTHLVKGSSTRHRSIRNCVEALSKDVVEGDGLSIATADCVVKDEEDAVVIVHDAVRPFVNEETLRKIATAANEHGVNKYR